MLTAATPIAFVAVTSADRAKKFYGQVLGLRLIGEDPFAVVFESGGVQLRLSIVPQVVTVPYTGLGWQVDDIGAMAAKLAVAGVQPQRYPGLVQDAQGVWTSPAGAKVLWFADPDGNTLSVTEC